MTYLGVIILARKLDFEEGPRTLGMHVLAYTDDTPPRSADISLTVQVLDVNDNRPIFVQQVTYLKSIFSENDFNIIICLERRTPNDTGCAGQGIEILLAEIEINPVKI